MATLNNSLKINLRTVLFLACVTLIVFNPCALAHTDVTAEQARDLIESTNDLVVVDVREPYEYCDAAGHITGALNYPLSSGILEAHYEELSKDGPVLVVCRSGRRSNVAANFLDSKGFSMVYDMMGGMSAWIWETEPCKDDSEPIESAGMNTYVFLPGQSTMVQTGGIAGVHWTYSVEGLFQLTVDPNEGTASFVHVDANATDDNPLQRTLDPNEVFNMTTLAGAVLDDTMISFTGKADDSSDVLITVTIEDDLAYLVGETIPPPNTADFFMFSLDAVAQRKYSGGTGEPNDPYQIATAEDLILLGETPEDYDKHFILTDDIDLDPNLSGRKVFDKAVIAPITHPTGSWPEFHDTPFTGIFDGNGYNISHLAITGEDYLGLFGELGYGATIKNLGLDAVYVNGTGASIGGLVGWNHGAITKCYVRGSVSGKNSVGGLAGANRGHGTIARCFAICTVQADESGGGLVGVNAGKGMVLTAQGPFLPKEPPATISDCYSILVGESRVSGLLIGQNGEEEPDEWWAGLTHFHTFINNCYASCDDSGIVEASGLVGTNLREEALNCFWDAEACGVADSAEGGTPKTTVEMQRAGTFIDAGWDFVYETANGTDDIWWILEGQDYPRLWWEP